MPATTLDPPMTVRRLYFNRIAAAFVRGHALRRGGEDVFGHLRNSPLGSLGADEIELLLQQGRTKGLRLERFERTMREPRLQRIFCALDGIAPRNLLHVGTGSGDALWPLLEEFPRIAVTAIDRDPRAIADVQAVRDGGCDRVVCMRMEADALDFADSTFDVVTLLDALPELADPERAIAEAVRVARQFVIVSVPSLGARTGSLPGADPETLRELLQRAGCRRVSVSPVLGHLVAIASVDGG